MTMRKHSNFFGGRFHSKIINILKILHNFGRIGVGCQTGYEKFHNFFNEGFPEDKVIPK